MKETTAYRLPPFSIQLSEVNGITDAPDWVQVSRAGTFYKGDQKIPITRATLSSLKKNFDGKVRGIDLAMDYFHDSDKVAAGWFKAVELRNDGNELWAQIDWTKTGRQKLAEKELRYVSADIDFDYQDNETKKKFGPVLLGAGLTNRPVIKGMAPTTQLSEFSEETNMDEKALKELQDSIAKLTATVTTLAESTSAQGKKLEELSAKFHETEASDKSDKDSDGDSDGDSDSDTSAEYDEFDESSFDEAAFDEMSDTDKKKCMLAAVGKLKAGKKKAALSEKEVKFSELLAKGKAVPAQKEAFLKGDMVKFAELAQKTNPKPKGSGARPQVEAGVSAQDQIIQLAQEKVKAGEAKDIVEAQSVVLSENPELNKRFVEEMTF